MKYHSYTSLSTFKQCPLKYRYRYIDRLKPDIEFIEAFMGKCVHKVLEAFYDPSVTTHGDLELDDHLCYFDHVWKWELHQGIRLPREGQTIEQYRAIGERCITNYFNRYAPFDRTRTLGIEMKVELPNITRGHSIVGYIDRLSYASKDDRVVEIHDYKTSKHLPSRKELEKDRQLSLYQIAVEGMYPNAERIELVWHYLYHDKELRLTRNYDDLNQIMDENLYKIHKIEIEKEFKARSGFLCKWCSYQYMCPSQKGRTGPESLPNGKLKECLTALSERIHGIRESITADLEKQGVLIDIDSSEEKILEELDQNGIAIGPLVEKIREYRFLLDRRDRYRKVLDRVSDRSDYERGGI